MAIGTIRFDAARCCTSEEASLSAQAVRLCCPVQSPTSLSKPMLARIECPWLLCWSVDISQCAKACSVILPTWCRKNGQFRFSDADPSCLVRSWWRVCASAIPTNIIRWSVWPKCSCGCSEAPREHSFRVPLACKVGALEQVEPLSGVCDIVFLMVSERFLRVCYSTCWMFATRLNFSHGFFQAGSGQNGQ